MRVIQIPLDLTPPSRYALDDWHRIDWQKGHRYYKAELRQDLWGDWVLTRRWGSRDEPSGGGRVLNTCHRSYQQGLRTLANTVRRRRRDGYAPTTPLPF